MGFADNDETLSGLPVEKTRFLLLEFCVGEDARVAQLREALQMTDLFRGERPRCSGRGRLLGCLLRCQLCLHRGGVRLSLHGILLGCL